jgi:hypothetical protein
MMDAAGYFEQFRGDTDNQRITALEAEVAQLKAIAQFYYDQLFTIDQDACYPEGVVPPGQPIEMIFHLRNIAYKALDKYDTALFTPPPAATEGGATRPTDDRSA